MNDLCICDRCGKLMGSSETRYRVRIQVYAGADPLVISVEEMFKDHTMAINELLEKCQGMTEEELMEDVYVEREFDLCRNCQKEYIKRPIP